MQYILILALFYHFWFSKLLDPHSLYFFCTLNNCRNVYNSKYMESLGLILFQPLFLLCFCFKNLDLSDMQLDHLDLSLITLFYYSFGSNIISVFFCSLNNRCACFIMMAIYFRTYYNVSDITELFFLTLILIAFLKDCLLGIFSLILWLIL